ncbi:MAG: efflux RND transporter periplasmic adaptor subunit [Candidatus Omnitrophica bacterium]|nr:efflux RND transporter periplasmic adaptor subunit [Candidatus Omnitrophota bacterium]
MKNQSGAVRWILVLILVLAAFAGGIFVEHQRSSSVGERSTDGASSSGTAPAKETAEAAKPQWWTCSMHPQIKLPSGDMKCPICFMDLIPLDDSGGGDAGIPEITLSERARFLAEIETAPAEHRQATKTLRLVGKIQADESRLAFISARVPGRLERLFVDFTGIKVRQGDHMVEIYSPELYSAQQELLQAVQTDRQMQGEASNLLKNTGQSLIQASKEKLVRLGLTQEQVEEVLKSGSPEDTVTLYSPTSGIVMRREGTVGMYVDEGDPIYTIADLSMVWLMLDAYESDLAWLHYGQNVSFEAEAFPGEIFQGKLTFISPVLDERSRTIKLRINVPNSNERLKPGMFVRATVQATPAQGGRVLAPEFAGKWLCPMHPEVVEDLFGFCSICGMKLETAQSLGFETLPSDEELPLVIPDTAPLITGKRAIVYVEEKREDGVFYIGREVELGPHADGYYVVESGIQAGERVVTKGNFKIDSAFQIVAKPSMMSLDGSSSDSTGDQQPSQLFDAFSDNEPLAGAVRPVFEAYLALQEALAGDSFDNAEKASKNLAHLLGELKPAGLPEEQQPAWEKDQQALAAAAGEAGKAADIELLREKFEGVSKAINLWIRHFGNPLDQPLKHSFCPMAFDNKGAYWIQTGDTIANPYFGSKMLRCGEIRKTYPARGVKE